MTNSNANAKQRQGSVKNTNASENNSNTGNNNDNVVQEAVQQENVRSERKRVRTSRKLSNGLTEETGKKVPLDVNKPEFQDKLFELNWYLGIANPVFKPVKKNVNVRGSDGKIVSKEIEKNAFSHYEYYSVNGQSFEEWVKETFGPDYLVDDVNNQVYTLVEKEGGSQPAPEPNTPNPDAADAEVQPTPQEETNTNDPENN